jgi:LysR family transcriptional regulator, glycine cleavage system transcriptional activator
LGVRVVRRSGRGIELTTWGTIYLQRVLAAVEQLRKAQEDVERARRSNHLSVSALPSLATKWLGPLLFEWKAQHPNASVLIEGVDGEPRLDDGDADFRVSYGARRRAHKRYLHLFTDHVVAVASPALVAASGPLGHPRDLVSKPLLWIDWGPEYVAPPTWRDWMIAAGVSAEHLQCNLTFSLSSAAVDAAIEGRGFALAQYSMAATALSNGALVKIFPQTLPLPEAYFLAWNGSAVDKPLAAAFHAWLLAEARRFDNSSTRQ